MDKKTVNSQTKQSLARKQNCLPPSSRACRERLHRTSCVISKAREDLPCLQRVKRARRNRRRMGACPLCHFEGARRFTLLARGKMSAPQSAAYGRMPMATCCRKRQLFSCRLPSASERRNLWNIAAGALCSLFGNTICIRPSRGGAKTRSTRRRSFSAARSG